MAVHTLGKDIGRISKSKPPHIAITTLGRFCLSAAAVDQIKTEGQCNYAFFRLNDNTHVLSVHPIKTKDPKSYKITYNGKHGRSATIAAKSVCQRMGYNYGESRSFPARWNRKKFAFEIDLQKPGTPPATGVKSK